MDRRNAAGKIFEFHLRKTALGHHLHKSLLIRKFRDGVRKIFICSTRSADESANPRQHLIEIEIEDASESRNDRTRKFEYDDLAAGF